MGFQLQGWEGRRSGKRGPLDGAPAGVARGFGCLGGKTWGRVVSGAPRRLGGENEDRVALVAGQHHHPDRGAQDSQRALPWGASLVTRPTVPSPRVGGHLEATLMEAEKQLLTLEQEGGLCGMRGWKAGSQRTLRAQEGVMTSASLVRRALGRTAFGLSQVRCPTPAHYPWPEGWVTSHDGLLEPYSVMPTTEGTTTPSCPRTPPGKRWEPSPGWGSTCWT